MQAQGRVSLGRRLLRLRRLWGTPLQQAPCSPPCLSIQAPSAPQAPPMLRPAVQVITQNAAEMLRPSQRFKTLEGAGN